MSQMLIQRAKKKQWMKRLLSRSPPAILPYAKSSNLPNLRNIQHPHHCQLSSGNTHIYCQTNKVISTRPEALCVTEREHFLCVLISGNRTRVDSCKKENHKQIALTFFCFVCTIYRWPEDKAHMVLIRELKHVLSHRWAMNQR